MSEFQEELQEEERYMQRYQTASCLLKAVKAVLWFAACALLYLLLQSSLVN